MIALRNSIEKIIIYFDVKIVLFLSTKLYTFVRKYVIIMSQNNSEGVLDYEEESLETLYCNICGM